MKQLYENYTKEDLVVWSTLFNRQMENLKNKASVDYLYALDEMKSVLTQTLKWMVFNKILNNINNLSVLMQNDNDLDI